MDREEILESIKAARRAHQKWVQEAYKLVTSHKISEGELPVKYTECTFGKWLHSDGALLVRLDSKEALEEINIKHQMLHIEYKKIYEIFFHEEEEQSFLGKLLHLKPSISEEENAVALHYYKILEAISDNLLELMESLEKRIAALPRNVFDAIN
jgi:hypothetical protein